MSNIASDWEFLLVLLASAIAVGSHAYSSYRDSVPGGSSSISLFFATSFLPKEARLPKGAFLPKATLRMLASRRQFMVGFLVYLALIEALFLTLVSSPAVLEIAMSTIGNVAAFGALAPTVGGTSAPTPLFAAAVIIALSGSKLFRRTELAALQLAHGVAGIPTRLDTVLESISSEAFIDDLKKDDELSRAVRLVRVRNARERPLSDEEWTLQLLYTLMYGNSGSRYLPAEVRNVLKLCERDMVDLYFHVLSRPEEGAALQADAHVPAGGNVAAVDRKGVAAEKWDMAVRTDDAIEAFLRLLAILLVKYGEDVSKVNHQSTPLGRVASSVLAESEDVFMPRASRIAQASAAGGFAIALAVASLCYLGQYLFHDIRPSLLLFDSQTESVLVRGLPREDYLISVYGTSLMRAFWEAAGIGLIFIVSSAVVLAAKVSRSSRAGTSESWRRSTAWLESASVAVLSVVVALSVYFALLFFRIVVLPQVFFEKAAGSASLLNDFGTVYTPHVLFAVLAAPVALAIGRIYDELAAEQQPHPHSRVALGTVWRYALYAGLVNLATRFLVDAVSSVDEMLWSVLYPGGYVLIYLLVYRAQAALDVRKMRKRSSSGKTTEADSGPGTGTSASTEVGETEQADAGQSESTIPVAPGPADAKPS